FRDRPAVAAAYQPVQDAAREFNRLQGLASDFAEQADAYGLANPFTGDPAHDLPLGAEYERLGELAQKYANQAAQTAEYMKLKNNEYQAVRMEEALKVIGTTPWTGGTFTVHPDSPWWIGLDASGERRALVEAEIRKALEEQVRRLIPEELLSTMQIDVAFDPRNGRAYYNSTTAVPSVSLMADNRPTTLLHEFGHAVEDQHPAIGRASLEFLDRRTRGEAAEYLAALKPSGGYDSHEMTRKDQFLDPYMGKDYGRTATEILSMGLEEMMKDPVAFAEKDPEMFDYIWSTLRTTPTGEPRIGGPPVIKKE
ncbi:MAG TPA: hypothetical protein VLD58_14205, partial [Gemmatimonadales bacterium]|nr:hypothetical protein [Gemmatimonadales bacterium]